MPNKKSRNKGKFEPDFDLPPTSLLKTHNLSAIKERKHRKKKKQGKSWEHEDDTPKAFARLMAGGPKRCGLDNGSAGRKRKRQNNEEQELKAARADLKIQPGESLGAFARRVDAAIPVKFPRGGNGAEKGPLKKKERAKEVVEPTEEEIEEEEIHSDDDEEEEDKKEMLRQAQAGFEAAKRKRGKKRDDSPDPWAELEKRREAIKFGEVAHAPPTLKKPKPLLYMAGTKGNRAAVDVDGVPKSAGSLAKREELAGERRSLIEAYRKMMGEKRAGETL
ncbi:hypothetical protein FN846DRAFT_903242 [Sphaerosporella brunnea]|uniref:Uncharacterized protein n=1 Tax=Sphaerosporella brunnea TaxID=1250544 RepID=A0A5J5F826_9PEZI|nr:hypothetical protein FN846DRAFT_903242 [Sphaerosporella brunnea]